MKELAREIEESVVKNMPEQKVLEKALDRLSGDIELTEDERDGVLRDLERVWHLMRLMKLMSEYFRDLISFGGGAVLNYMYMVEKGEAPRFTFDLDSAWMAPVSAKRGILVHIPLFNRWLAKSGYVMKIPIGKKYAWLWVAEYDVEKDFFPEVLSMRVPVLMRWSGEPFYRFLGVSDYGTISELREAFLKTIGVRDPLIDYVRFEVSLGMHDKPVVRLEAADLFGNNHRALVTEPELQLAWKIVGKVGKKHDNPETALHDILKAVLDLRLIKYFDAGKVRDYVVKKEGPEAILKNAESNLRLIREKGGEHWRGHHYVLVRKKMALEEFVERAGEALRLVL